MRTIFGTICPAAGANRKLLRTDGSCYKPAARGIAAKHDAVLDAVLAGVAELVDALDLGSSDESCGGSSPSARTIIVNNLAAMPGQNPQAAAVVIRTNQLLVEPVIGPPQVAARRRGMDGQQVYPHNVAEG
jgi:hypothetical protein